MNTLIAQHFDEIEAKLIACPAIISYRVLRREVSSADGKLRIKATSNDGGMVELFEYVGEASGRVHLLKYGFHWQDSHGHLQRRWDNAPHYPALPNAPHHIHDADGSVRAIADTPDIFSFIQEIENAITR